METTGIKLFGKKITCFDNPKNTVFTGEELSDCSTNDEHLEEVDQVRERKQQDGNPTFEDVGQDSEGDATNSQLKKPDTILPCPRCKSMDTKFCYYNNYNVKQPRHFCKSCQRYWTAGGTMRTMPVGAGRRRNKNPTATQCRFETIVSQDAFQASQINGVPPNLVSFGLDFVHVDNKDKENGGDECSNGSTVTTSNSVSEKSQDKNEFHSHVPRIPPGVCWSYNPWNSAVPIPSIYPAGYSPMPMPIYPSPYWNYIPNWLPISSPTQSDINSSVLGKHSRQPELIKSNISEEPKKQKNQVLIPKTLRMDDPNDAAKSSIWSTLGIQNVNISTRGLFKTFQTKGDEISNSSPVVLQANPAALSRSLCFQERA